MSDPVDFRFEMIVFICYLLNTLFAFTYQMLSVVFIMLHGVNMINRIIYPPLCGFKRMFCAKSFMFQPTQFRFVRLTGRFFLGYSGLILPFYSLPLSIFALLLFSMTYVLINLDINLLLSFIARCLNLLINLRIKIWVVIEL